MKKRLTGVLLLVAGIAVCLGAGYKIVAIKREYKVSDTLYAEQEKKFVKSEEKAEPDDEEAFNGITVNFEGLKKENPDICGWIYVPAISVSYPVLQGENNDAYLRHLPDGRYNTAGSIFVDERCKNDFSSAVTILYGHNMNNGTMFGKLKKFLDPTFLKENAAFEIYMPGKVLKAKVLSCFETKSSSQIYKLPDKDDDFQTYTQILSAESKTDLSGIDAEKENLLLLSTCSRSFESGRTVVIARIEK